MLAHAAPASPAPARDREWLERTAQRINSDPEMALVASLLDTTISFTFGNERHHLVFRAGKLVDIRHGKKLEWRADFGFRASNATWDRFFQNPPPPLYNSVFGMIMRVEDFELEGDTLVLAQNARAVTRLLTIIQEEGRA